MPYWYGGRLVNHYNVVIFMNDLQRLCRDRRLVSVHRVTNYIIVFDNPVHDSNFSVHWGRRKGGAAFGRKGGAAFGKKGGAAFGRKGGAAFGRKGGTAFGRKGGAAFGRKGGGK